MSARGEPCDAIGVVPKRPGLRALPARLEPAAEGTALCDVVVASCCGTDRALQHGLYGAPADGHDDIVIGHEAVLRVRAVYGDARIAPGDGLYVAVVREARPDAPAAVRRAPHLATDPAAFTERGLSGKDGWLRPQAVVAASALIPVALPPEAATWMEPASTVCHGLRIALAQWTVVAGAIDDLLPRRALVLGVGSCGLLAIARLRQQGFEVAAVDRVDAATPRARLAARLGAAYHPIGASADGHLPALADGGPYRIVFDACGHPSVKGTHERLLGPGGQLVEFGIPHETHVAPVDLTADGLFRTVGTRGRQGAINADRAAWGEAEALLHHLRASAPWFFAEATVVLDGLRCAELAAALADPAIVKTAIRIGR